MQKEIDLVRLTNTGSAGCTLRGYPTVRSFTAEGRAVPVRFSRSPNTLFGVPLPVRTVTLQPRGTARVLIGVGFYNCDSRPRPGRVVLTLPDDPGQLALASFGGQALCPEHDAWASSMFGADVDPYQPAS